MLFTFIHKILLSSEFGSGCGLTYIPLNKQFLYFKEVSVWLGGQNYELKWVEIKQSLKSSIPELVLQSLPKDPTFPGLCSASVLVSACTFCASFPNFLSICPYSAGLCPSLCHFSSDSELQPKISGCSSRKCVACKSISPNLSHTDCVWKTGRHIHSIFKQHSCPAVFKDDFTF